MIPFTCCFFIFTNIVKLNTQRIQEKSFVYKIVMCFQLFSVHFDANLNKYIFRMLCVYVLGVHLFRILLCSHFTVYTFPKRIRARQVFTEFYYLLVLIL